MSSNEILERRARTHGDFAHVAYAGQEMRCIIRAMPGWQNMSFQHREALDCIIMKIARASCGDANEPDHWRDLQGYALLGERACIGGGE